MLIGFFPKIAKIRRGSKKYEIDLSVPQSKSILISVLTITPGKYLTLFPD